MPSVTPIDENASWTRTAAPAGRCAAHAGRRSESSSRACRRCRAGRRPVQVGLARVEYSATRSTRSATPASATCRSNFFRVGVPPKSRPSTNGSIATRRAPRAARAAARTTVERPWWLPISRARAGPQAPRLVVQQPGLGLGQPAGHLVGQLPGTREGDGVVGDVEVRQPGHLGSLRRGYTLAAD